MNSSCKIQTRSVLLVLGNVFFCISLILTTTRRELEKLKKDLEEEKLLRSNLEVILAINGERGLEVCILNLLPQKSLNKPPQPLIYRCVTVWLRESLTRQLDVCRRFTVHPSSDFFIWKIIFNDMFGFWDVSSV